MDSIKLKFSSPKPKKLSTVYVVEDNPVQSTMLTDYFDKYPEVDVKAFSTGDACIKDVVMAKNPPDLILLDYFLDSGAPSKDGLDTLEKIKEVSPNTHIIMLTAVDNERMVELAKKKGALAYVVKGASSFEKLDAIIKNNFTLQNSQSED